MKRTTEALGLAWLLATTPAPAGADDIDTDWIDFDRIERGEIVARTGKGEEAATADVALRIDADPEAIYEILKACEVSPEYAPHVERCESLEVVDDGRGELFVQEVKPAFFLPSFEHVFRLDYEPFERIDVSRVSGPLDHMEGSWNLIEQDDGSTLLVHSLAVNPGMPIPRFIVRARLSNDLPDVLEEIRRRAEARAEQASPP